MSQHSFSISNEAGAAFRADVNNALQALASCSRGAVAPATTYAGQVWDDSTANVQKKRNTANAAWIVKMTLDETFVLSRSSNTILGLSDIGKTIVVTSTFTQTLTAAATLADGWWLMYRNDGTGVITLDPNGAETIDGAATLDLYPSESCVITCNGSAFKTIGLRAAGIKVGNFSRDISTATGTQAITGVGFKPRAIVFLSCVGGSSRTSWGADSQAAQGAITDNDSVTPNTFGIVTTHSLYMQLTGADIAKALIQSMDTDGFTLSWTKVGSPTGSATVVYLAVR